MIAKTSKSQMYFPKKYGKYAPITIPNRKALHFSIHTSAHGHTFVRSSFISYNLQESNSYNLSYHIRTSAEISGLQNFRLLLHPM